VVKDGAKHEHSGKIWIARRVVQVFALLLFCLPAIMLGFGLFGTFSGKEQIGTTASMLPFFGSLSSSSIASLVLIDPFAILQTIAASKTFDVKWLIGILPVVLFYGLIKGRAFCGWVCPVNFLLEGVNWLREKLGIQVQEHALPRHTKLFVALGILVLSAITSKLVFEMLSPISAINKGIIFGSLTGLITLAAILVAELLWGKRIWCRALCPLGGFYEALGAVGLVSVKMDHDACIHCNKCKDVCLADPEILEPVLADETKRVEAGDCMACAACCDVCPTKALTLGLAAPTRTASAGKSAEAGGVKAAKSTKDTAA